MIGQNVAELEVLKRAVYKLVWCSHNITKTDLKERGWEGMALGHQDEDRDKRSAVLNMVRNCKDCNYPTYYGKELLGFINYREILKQVRKDVAPCS